MVSLCVLAALWRDEDEQRTHNGNSSSDKKLLFFLLLFIRSNARWAQHVGNGQAGAGSRRCENTQLLADIDAFKSSKTSDIPARGACAISFPAQTADG